MRAFEHPGQGVPLWLYIADGKVTIGAVDALQLEDGSLHTLDVDVIGALVLLATYHATSVIPWADAVRLACRGKRGLERRLLRALETRKLRVVGVAA